MPFHFNFIPLQAIHSFNKYLLTVYILGTVLIANRAIKKTKIFALLELTFMYEEKDNKQNISTNLSAKA